MLTSVAITLDAGDLGGERDRDAAAAGSEVGDAQFRCPAASRRKATARWTSVSVSGRGTSTSGVTANGRP